MKMKRFIGIAAAAVMTFAMTTAALADTVDYSWSENFNGKSIDTTFVAKDIDSKLSDVQPGDELDLTVTTKNSSDISTNWYLSNTVIDNLEAGAAEDGAYTYVLSYNGQDIFSSDTVGGDNGTGLDDATNATGDVYLGKLDAGQSGTVTLKIVFEGETLDNDYQIKDSTVRLQFAVENATTNTVITNTVTAKTNDVNNMWSYIGLAAGGVLIIAAFVVMKKSRKEEQ